MTEFADCETEENLSTHIKYNKKEITLMEARMTTEINQQLIIIIANFNRSMLHDPGCDGTGHQRAAPWCMLFADDIVRCSTRRDHVERKLEEWRTAMEERGLKISRRKTEYRCNEHQDAEIQLQGEPLKRVKTFTYLGSTLAEDGELDAEVTHRVQSGWKNWKRVSGVLCDRRMNMKVKGKVYRTVVRPALMYGAETWALKKAQEKKLEVAEMRMLRWMCGVTKLDKIRNERIRGTTKVGEITKKVQERGLKWYGHVMRREEHYVGRRACDAKRGTLRRKEGDGNESTGEKEERKT